MLTDIDAVVAPVLHNKDPDAAVESVEVPSQLSVTVTTGAVGVGFTVIVALALFEQPLVSVNEYVIICDPAPAVTGSNIPVLFTPVPLNAPPAGDATN